MTGIPVDDYVDKILLLERRAGREACYDMLEPATLQPGDIIAIQESAKRISQFVGLGDVTFIVAVAKQNENLGGHIELKGDQNEVFVEISPDIAQVGAAIQAALAHEITHKWLHRNRISLGNTPLHEYHNEILTDVAGVFLGLGKVMLNGYECQTVREEFLPEGGTAITTDFKCGYLRLHQLAFVYSLVCAMRRIPKTSCARGLSERALKALGESQTKYPRLFRDDYHSPDCERKLAAGLEDAVAAMQRSLLELDKHILYVKEAGIAPVEAFLAEAHQRAHEVLMSLRSGADDAEHDPAVQFVKALKLTCIVDKQIGEMDSFGTKARRYLSYTEKLGGILAHSGGWFPKPSADMFWVLTCWNDHTRLRLPESSSRLVAKCPRCQYRFEANTTPPSFLRPVPHETEPHMKEAPPSEPGANGQAVAVPRLKPDVVAKILCVLVFAAVAFLILWALFRAY